MRWGQALICCDSTQQALTRAKQLTGILANVQHSSGMRRACGALSHLSGSLPPGRRCSVFSSQYKKLRMVRTSRPFFVSASSRRPIPALSPLLETKSALVPHQAPFAAGYASHCSRMLEVCARFHITCRRRLPVQRRTPPRMDKGRRILTCEAQLREHSFELSVRRQASSV